MINHWIGGSTLCWDFHDWLRNGTLATASPVVVLVLPRALELLGASEANYVSKKKQQDIVVSEWIYISFTLKLFGHLNMKSDHELVDGTGTHTCPLKAAVLERIPQASPFKILSCKEPTKVLLSPSKSKIQRSDSASLADKALQSLQGLRRRHPSEHSSCGGETWNIVKPSISRLVLHSLIKPDQTLYFLGWGYGSKWLTPLFVMVLDLKNHQEPFLNPNSPIFPDPDSIWLRHSHCHGLLLLLHILGLQLQSQGSYLRCIHGQAPNLKGFSWGNLEFDNSHVCCSNLKTTAKQESLYHG